MKSARRFASARRPSIGYAEKKIGAHRHRMGGFSSPGYWLWSLSAVKPAEHEAHTPAEALTSDEPPDSAIDTAEAATDSPEDCANDAVPESCEPAAC